jgi:hypothetical protein
MPARFDDLLEATFSRRTDEDAIVVGRRFCARRL